MLTHTDGTVSGAPSSQVKLYVVRRSTRGETSVTQVEIKHYVYDGVAERTVSSAERKFLLVAARRGCFVLDAHVFTNVLHANRRALDTGVCNSAPDHWGDTCFDTTR